MGTRARIHRLLRRVRRRRRVRRLFLRLWRWGRSRRSRLRPRRSPFPPGNSRAAPRSILPRGNRSPRPSRSPRPGSRRRRLILELRARPRRRLLLRPPAPSHPKTTRDGGVGIQASKTSSKDDDATMRLPSRRGRPRLVVRAAVGHVQAPRVDGAIAERARPAAREHHAGRRRGRAEWERSDRRWSGRGWSRGDGMAKKVTRVEDAMTAEEMMERATEAAARARGAQE